VQPVRRKSADNYGERNRTREWTSASMHGHGSWSWPAEDVLIGVEASPRFGLSGTRVLDRDDPDQKPIPLAMDRPPPTAPHSQAHLREDQRHVPGIWT
jgi:hypothetical protein